MSASSLFAFAAAYFAVLVLPGPGVTAIVARALTRGMHGAPAFIAGFVVGALIWFTVAATGLAVVAARFGSVFTAIRYAGAAYLIYLAYRFWRAPARPLQMAEVAAEGHARLFLTGLAINLGNPKVIAFFLALLPTVVDLAALTALGFAELALTIVVIVSIVLGAYAAAAARARRLFTSPGAVRWLNRGSGLVMAGAAVTIVKS